MFVNVGKEKVILINVKKKRSIMFCCTCYLHLCLYYIHNNRTKEGWIGVAILTVVGFEHVGYHLDNHCSVLSVNPGN